MKTPLWCTLLGHKWNEWKPLSKDNRPVIYVRSCKRCGAIRYWKEKKQWNRI